MGGDIRRCRGLASYIHVGRGGGGLALGWSRLDMAHRSTAQCGTEVVWLGLCRVLTQCVEDSHCWMRWNLERHMVVFGTAYG